MNIPYRFSKAIFNQVAPILVMALDSYPKPYVLTSPRLSILTMARRIREAIDAKRRYGHTYPGLNDAKFTASKLVVSPQADRIIIGPPGCVKKHIEDVTVIAATLPTAIPEVMVSPSALQAFCSIMNRLDPRPSNFVTTDITPQMAAQLETTYDVAFDIDENDETKYHIL